MNVNLGAAINVICLLVGSSFLELCNFKVHVHFMENNPTPMTTLFRLSMLSSPRRIFSHRMQVVARIKLGRPSEQPPANTNNAYAK